MNPLPRFLGMVLFLVLAVLAALLAAPLWQHRAYPSLPTTSNQPPAVAAGSVPSNPTAPPAHPARVAVFSQRVTLVLALVGLAVTAALLFSLAARPVSSVSQPPFATARQEMDALAKLAENSVAQGAELSRERDVRRRAEEDAQLKQELLAQSLDEKIRLGQNLHDGIIQSLYAVGLTLEAMRPLLKTNPVQAEQRLEQIRASLNVAIRDVRTYITGLAPENLRRASFGHSLTAMFEQLKATREVQLDVDVDDKAAASLTGDQNIEALQIAREAISNALRHGEASQIKLRMHKSDGEICLLVQDNGHGFDPGEDRDGGHGLANMRARADKLGASLRVTSQPGQGARVIATFPLQQPSAV